METRGGKEAMHETDLLAAFAALALSTCLPNDAFARGGFRGGGFGGGFRGAAIGGGFRGAAIGGGFGEPGSAAFGEPGSAVFAAPSAVVSARPRSAAFRGPAVAGGLRRAAVAPGAFRGAAIRTAAFRGPAFRRRAFFPVAAGVGFGSGWDTVTPTAMATATPASFGRDMAGSTSATERI